MSKQKTLWLSRDSRFDTDKYDLFSSKPRKITMRCGVMYCTPGRCAIRETFCAQMFEKATGYKLKRGELKKVRITVEEVE